MSLLLIVFLSITASLSAMAAEPQHGVERPAPKKVNADANVFISPEDKDKIARLLQEGQRLRDLYSSEEYISMFMARQFLGTPYVSHTLDRTDSEHMVVNLHELDCTTFVENVAALTLCALRGKTKVADYVGMLRRLRYRGGVMSYENRLHYYQWWVTDNQAMGLVRQIDEPVQIFRGRQKLRINYMSTHAQSYAMLRNHPERVRALKTLEDQTNGTEVRYIPTVLVADKVLMQQVVHNGDIIAIVTAKNNLDTSHLGIASWHQDGLHLINASSMRRNGNQVVEPSESLYDYLRGQPSALGIRVARIVNK